MMPREGERGGGGGEGGGGAYRGGPASNGRGGGGSSAWRGGDRGVGSGVSAGGGGPHDEGEAYGSEDSRWQPWRGGREPHGGYRGAGERDRREGRPPPPPLSRGGYEGGGGYRDEDRGRDRGGEGYRDDDRGGRDRGGYRPRDRDRDRGEGGGYYSSGGYYRDYRRERGGDRGGSGVQTSADRQHRSPSIPRPSSTSRGGERGGEGGQRKKRLNRDISTSRERSRSRERRRRRQQAECIRRAGGFQKLADSEGHEPIRLFWDGFQWVAKAAGALGPQQLDAAAMNSTRKLRRLYFGNLPLHAGLTEQMFQEMVWEEMKIRGFCSNPNVNPVLYVWFAKDKGNYGFVEFTSVEETERALTMDGMLCLGVPLKVSRPNDYTTTSSAQTHAMTVMGQQAAAILLGGAAAAATPQPPQPPPGPPPGTSRYMRIIQVVETAKIQSSEDYEDIYEDVKEGCSKFGEVVGGVIITPDNRGSSPYLLCDVLFEFATAEACDNCISNMSTRRYEGKQITAIRLDAEEVETFVIPLINKHK